MANPFEVASFNLTNFANIYPDLMDDEPKDVEYVYKDENGNIRTKSVANRGKFKKQLWDDVGGALGQMSRVFYVDQVNGDDNNDGSSSYPFKTLKKAISNVPVGGTGTIVLVGDYVFGSTDGPIILRNKKIAIKTYSGASLSVEPYHRRDGLVQYTRFYLEGSHLGIYMESGSKIELLENNTGKNVTYPAFVMGSSYDLTESSFSLYMNANGTTTEVILRNNALYGLYSSMPIAYNGSVAIGGYARNGGNCKIIIETSTGAALVNATSRCIDFSIINAHLNIIDENGNVLGIQDYIAGIVMDSNGNILNIQRNKE